jgi:hypothetical protein
MKTNKIITATLLSAGLILGTTSAAYAVDPAPSANLTVASYSSQFATYNLMSSAFDSATTTFQAETATYATALAAYKVSDAALQLAYKSVLTANSPITTTAKYTTLLAAFKTATVAYNSSAALFNSQSNAYQAAIQSYEKSYQTVVAGYKVTLGMYEDLNATIYMAFETAVHNANNKFAVALRASKTKAQTASVTKVRHSAIVAAIATRSAARVALGAKPISPIQQIKIGQKIDTFKGIRPVRPVKAV